MWERGLFFLKLERKQIFACVGSVVMLVAIALNIFYYQPLTAVEPVKEAPLPVGNVVYIPSVGNGSAQLVYQGLASTGDKRIAFTFDSGWIAEYTPALLQILKDKNVPATFFHRGKWAESNPHLVRQMVEDGHLIGNHSYTHPYMDRLSAVKVEEEIRKATEVLENLAGYKPWLYRPPYGACSPAVRKELAEQGYTHSVMWTIDTHDWKNPGVQYIINRVVDNAKDGAIVLMHVGAPQTITALPTMIDKLREMGYTFALLDDLLEPVAAADGRIPHRVRDGETLESLAQKFGVVPEELLTLNPGLKDK